MIRRIDMASHEQRGNKEAKKPKKQKPKTIAAAPTQKGSTQPAAPPTKPQKR
jgi:hypothetical protein